MHWKEFLRPRVTRTHNVKIDGKFIVDWAIFISIVGVIATIFGIYKYESGKKMVQKALKRKDDHEDIQRFRNLLAKLKDAKNVALGRQKAASKIFSKGIPLALGDAVIQKAQDALKTELPLSLDVSTQKAAFKTADEIQKAFVKIQMGFNGRDHWSDIFSDLQNIIPELQKAERKKQNDMLLP